MPRCLTYPIDDWEALPDTDLYRRTEVAEGILLSSPDHPPATRRADPPLTSTI